MLLAALTNRIWINSWIFVTSQTWNGTESERDAVIFGIASAIWKLSIENGYIGIDDLVNISKNHWIAIRSALCVSPETNVFNTLFGVDSLSEWPAYICRPYDKLVAYEKAIFVFELIGRIEP